MSAQDSPPEVDLDAIRARLKAVEDAVRAIKDTAKDGKIPEDVETLWCQATHELEDHAYRDIAALLHLVDEQGEEIEKRGERAAQLVDEWADNYFSNRTVAPDPYDGEYVARRILPNIANAIRNMKSP